MLPKILIVDDDVTLAKMVGGLLLEHGYQVIIANTAEDGIKLARSEKPQLLLLDVMVPVAGGWQVCQEIRTFSDVPIIFLTAMGASENIVKGLNLGADDYIVKPFEQPVILARIQAQLRRTKQSNMPEKMVFADGDLIINLMNRTVTVAQKEKELTPREFDLLIVLARHAGQVVTTEDLVQQAWGLFDQDAKANIKPYIHYLRKKIETDPASPRWILTMRGIGYRFSQD